MPKQRFFTTFLLASFILGCGSSEESKGNAGGASGQSGAGAAGRDSGAAGGAAGTGGSPADGGAGDGGGSVPPGTCGKDAAGAARSFCDPATWGGSVPTATSNLVVSGNVVVDCAAVARTIEIPAGATLRASRVKNSSLTLHGNLIVRGRLDYGSPDDRICDATAEIVFQGMDDEKFVGTPSPKGSGGTTPGVFPEPLEVPLTVMDSDFGVWVMDSGVFTAAGQAKKAWSKLTETTEPSDPTFSVENASGWRAGDRVVLTPSAKSAVADHFLQFDEATVKSVAGNDITLDAAPKFQHLGCTNCVRRAEAANLSRNVVVRSFDDTAHAHMIAGQSGLLQLDSIELRWLGPKKKCNRGAPARRAPIYFHAQRSASSDSYVRHVSIWGGNHHFLMQETSDGVEVNDVAGYDTVGTGFELFYDFSTCNTRCSGEKFVPLGTVFTDVLAAKVAVAERDDCNAIGGVVGINASGGEGTGCKGCVATGVAYNYGSFGNEAAIHSAEGGSGRPKAFTLNDNVAHNNAGNGLSNWQNAGELQPAYDGNQAWSNGENGIHHGAYGNSYQYTNLTSLDNAGADFAVIAIQTDPARPRVNGAVFDGFRTLPYFLVPSTPVVINNAEFTGVRNPAISQVPDKCSGGDENDPEDGTCIRNWLHFSNPKFPKGVKPFLFGWHQNKHSLWEVRGFSHADYPNLPQNFDLYRKDNMVPGGSYNAEFDAWLVPK